MTKDKFRFAPIALGRAEHTHTFKILDDEKGHLFFFFFVSSYVEVVKVTLLPFVSFVKDFFLYNISR